MRAGHLCLKFGRAGPLASLSSAVMSRTTKNILVAVPVILLLLAIAIPNFIKSRSVISMNACANNLRWIDGAKKEWALEGHKTTNDVPTESDLLAFLGGHTPADHRRGDFFPRCPSGGAYTIGALAEPPKCSIGGVGRTLPTD
jgi:hypothetical protein